MTPDDVTRMLPHAVGPEKSILSSIMRNPQEWVHAAIEERLTSGHFYLPANAVMFEQMLEAFDEHGEVELVSFVQRLVDKALIDHVGGPAAVTDIYTYAPTDSHFRQHLQIVKDKHVLRSLLQVSNDTIQRVHDEPEEVEATLDASEAALLAIRESRENLQTETLKSSVRWVIDDLQDRCEGKPGAVGLPTGYEVLDRMTNGLRGGDLFVLAARPSMGKTSLMMNIVERICMDQEKPSMVFSCEMPQRQLVQRLTYSRARYAYSQLSRGVKPDKGELMRIQRVAVEVANSKLRIDDTSGISISQLRAKARRAKRESDIQFIAIDYLQLMKSVTKQATNNREREIAEISAGLKGLAKELDIPILVLAQLNRDAEKRTGKSLGVPRMSDLRESGAIEQDADMVGLLHRRDYYATTEEEKEELAGQAELILAKNRNGETGHVPLTFIADLMRFESGAPERKEPDRRKTGKKDRFGNPIDD